MEAEKENPALKEEVEKVKKKEEKVKKEKGILLFNMAERSQEGKGEGSVCHFFVLVLIVSSCQRAVIDLSGPMIYI